MFKLIIEWLKITHISLEGKRWEIIKLYLLPSIIYFLVLTVLMALFGVATYYTTVSNQADAANTDMSGLIMIGVLLLAGISIVFGALLEFSVTNKTRNIFYGKDVKQPFMQEFLYLTKTPYFKLFVKTYVYKGLFTFLWSLLFVFPGIIKSLAYSQTTFVFIEKMERNEVFSATDPITQSRVMMDGNKGIGFIWTLILGLILNLVSIISSIAFPESTSSVYMSTSTDLVHYFKYAADYATSLPNNLEDLLNIVNMIYTFALIPFLSMGYVIFNTYVIQNQKPSFYNNYYK